MYLYFFVKDGSIVDLVFHRVLRGCVVDVQLLSLRWFGRGSFATPLRQPSIPMIVLKRC